MFGLKIGVGLERPDPVDQLTGGRPLLNITEIPHRIKGRNSIFQQLGVDCRKMHPNNSAHHFRLRKCNMMEIAAAQKRIGKVFLGVRGDNDHRAKGGLDGFIDFNNIKFHLVQNIQHVILKIRVGFIDLVNQ